MDQKSNGLASLRDSFTKSAYIESVFHMHASRSGPLLANEIYLSQKEKEQNPRLLLIRGLQQPHGTVAKFLGYWLSGLETTIAHDILSRIRLDGKNLYEDGLFKKDILNASACDVSCEWDALVDALVKPLFLVNDGILACYGFGAVNFEQLKKVRGGEKVPFEEAVTDISLAVVNTLLQKHNFPVYEIVRFNPREIVGLHVKYIQRNVLGDEYDYLCEKKRKHYESCYDTIAKLLKSYNGLFPEPQKLSRLIERSYRINPSFRELHIDQQEVRLRFEHPRIKRHIVLSYKEQIDIALSSHKRSIGEVTSSHLSDIYVDGENMVKTMFVLADMNNECLILQEFIRGTDYTLYQELVGNYPKVEFKLSACRIWDTEAFPEFDQNFIVALKYLDSTSEKGKGGTLFQK